MDCHCSNIVVAHIKVSQLIRSRDTRDGESSDGTEVGVARCIEATLL